jgi:hypothetical protein
LTKPPKICPDHEYGNGREDPIGSELIDTFESTFTLTDSGVTLPKIVVCIGSGKGRFKQLVKGADDTRQDAVMEQVFGYANKILKLQRHPKSNGIALYHDLRLVTYNIVPLSHAAGVRTNVAMSHFLKLFHCLNVSTFFDHRFSNGLIIQLLLEISSSIKLRGIRKVLQLESLGGILGTFPRNGQLIDVDSL